MSHSCLVSEFVLKNKRKNNKWDSKCVTFCINKNLDFFLSVYIALVRLLLMARGKGRKGRGRCDKARFLRLFKKVASISSL